MPEDPRERIEQIRARRAGGSIWGQDSISVAGINTGATPGISEATGARGIAGLQALDQALPGLDVRSPWLRDRVTLSLEAQITMMEQRANARLSLIDLGYTNRISILPIRPGIFIKIEPTGCYRLVYHNR